MNSHILAYVGTRDIWKNSMVWLFFTQPYFIVVCAAKSSRLFIGVSNTSVTKKLAKFAVYEAPVMKHV